MANEKQKAFHKYLDFQFGYSGDFLQALWQTIQRADPDNTNLLAEGFPHHVEAYRVWTQEGVDAFLGECDPEYSLTIRMREEHE